MAGCTSQSESIVSVVTPAPSLTRFRDHAGHPLPRRHGHEVEVVHFHPTRQCTSCTTVGEYANATVGKDFADERASGTVVFREINGRARGEPGDRRAVRRPGSSLVLGVYTSDGGFYPEENVKVWYRTDDRQRFMDYLKGVIEKRLAGDLSAA